MKDKLSKVLTFIRIRKLETSIILLGLFLFSVFLAYPLLLTEIPLPTGFSTPLLPSLITIFSEFFRLSPELSGRVVVFSFYVLMPPVFFLFVKYFTKNLLFALVSALLYTLPLPLAFIIPSWRMMIVEKGVVPLQALALLAEGEMQHIVGLFFLPLAGIFFLKFIRHGVPSSLVWGVVLATLLALTSRAALWAFLILSFALMISDSLLPRGRVKIRRAILFTLLYLGLSAFWYTPLFWGENLELAYEMGLVHGLGTLIPLSFVFLPILGTSIFLLCDRRPKRHVPLTIFLLYLFFGGTVFASEFFGLAFAPRPERYLLELHLASSLFWGYVAVYGFELLRKKEEEIGFDRLPPYRGGLLTVVTFACVLVFVILGGSLLRRSLYHLGQAIYLKGPAEAVLPSLVDRPLWDLTLGLFISLMSALFLLSVATWPAFLERIFTFLPRYLRGVRRRREQQQQ